MRRLLDSALATGLALGLLVLGCGERGDRLDRAPGSAVWVGAASDAPTQAELVALGRAGVGELFVEAGVLDWEDGAARLEPTPYPSLPTSTSATLVVGGRWSREEVDIAAVADVVVGAMEELRATARTRRLLPVGLHLDLRVPTEQLQQYAALLRRVGRGLERDVFLSVTCDRRWIDDEEAGAVAAAVDFTIGFVFGQRPGEVDEEALWTIDSAVTMAERLDGLGRPFLTAVATTGIAHLGRREWTTEVGLAQLGWDRRFELEHGFSLAAVDRQSYAFRAVAAAEVGDLRVGAGDRVQLVGLAAPRLHELLERLDALELGRGRGAVFYRVPNAGESWSLSLASLARVAGEGAVGPVIVAHGEPVGLARGRLAFRFGVENTAPEGTDLGTSDANYLQVELQGPGTIEAVAPGGFRGYDTLISKGGALERTIRGARIVRFHAPILAAGGEVWSGEVAVVGSRGPTFLLGGQFLARGGRVATFGPTEWSVPSEGEGPDE